MRPFVIETLLASAAYVVAFLLIFEVMMPLQNSFFPEYPSRASLLFLPHGVRVLTAWLLGWRAVIALLPGVFLVFLYVGGMDAFMPSRILAIIIALTVAPATFHIVKLIGHDLSPSADRTPCWPCVMGVGFVTSLVGASLTNLALGTGGVDFVAYVIGDIAGLFFLMLALLYLFRVLHRGRAG